MSKVEQRDVGPMTGEESSEDGCTMGRSKHGKNERYRGGGEQEQWWVGTVGSGRDNYQPMYA